MKSLVLAAIFALFSHIAQAADSHVFSASARLSLDTAVKSVSASLDEAGFAVVDELPIHENLKRMAPRWGEDYNRNKLEGIVSLVFCNGWYVNQVSNLDPSLLGLCPLHLTLIHKDGVTTALFNRPTAIAADSPAKAVLKEVEDKVTGAIKAGLHDK